LKEQEKCRAPGQFAPRCDPRSERRSRRETFRGFSASAVGDHLDTRVSVVTAVGGVGAGAAAPSSTGVGSLSVSSRTVPVGAVESPAQHAGDKEENAVDDGEDPASLEHGAVLVEGSTPLVATRVVVITDLNANGNANARAVGIGDTSVQVDTSDESTDKADVDDGDEWTGDVAISVELIEREHRPCASEDGNDE